MKNGFPGPQPREGWSTQGPARPCVTPGARSQPRQGQSLARAHLPPGRAILRCQTRAPCPALSLTGPDGEGCSRIHCRPLQTVWSPGLPLSRLLGSPFLQGTPCLVFSWTLEWSFWLWVEKQHLSQQLAGRCSWERCWLRALDQRLPGAGEGTEAAPSGVPACRPGFASDAIMTSRWPGCREGVWRGPGSDAAAWPCVPCLPLATGSPCRPPPVSSTGPHGCRGHRHSFRAALPQSAILQTLSHTCKTLL